MHAVARIAVVVALCVSPLAAQSAAKAVVPLEATAPYSEMMTDGETVYVSGTLGKAADSPRDQTPEAEARTLLDAIRKDLAERRMTMDDLLSVQVFCTDLKLYPTFNAVYRTYFHKALPARAFVGVNELVLGAHFEVLGIARHNAAATKHATP